MLRSVLRALPSPIPTKSNGAQPCQEESKLAALHIHTFESPGLGEAVATIFLDDVRTCEALTLNRSCAARIAQSSTNQLLELRKTDRLTFSRVANDVFKNVA